MPKWLTPQTQSIRTRLLQLLALGLPCLWLVSAWFAYDSGEHVYIEDDIKYLLYEFIEE